MKFSLKVKKAAKALRYTAWRSGNELGLLKGNPSFTPFIVLTRSRSGSNLLKNYLNSVSEVECFGEVFRHPDRLGWDRPGIYPKDFGIETYRQDPAEFLKTHFLKTQPGYVKAAGFKLFYYHSREDGREGLWDFLKQRTDIRILHLRRKNLIKVIASRELAMKTGVWIDHSGGEQTDASVSISPEAFKAEIETTQQWERSLPEFFSEHPYQELVFEDLVKTPEASLSEIQQFLGLSQSLKPISATKRQAKRPLSEILENFDELKAAFKGSDWARYFN